MLGARQAMSQSAKSAPSGSPREGQESARKPSIHCEGEIGFTAKRSHLSIAPDLVALFPLLADADRTTAAQYAIGARLEVGVDVVHIWRDVGVS